MRPEPLSDAVDRLARALERLALVLEVKPQEQALSRIEALLNTLIQKEKQIMALGQEILDAVTAETTVIDSFIALVNGLIANNTVTPAQGAAILAAIAADKAKIEAAIVANTPVAP